MTNLDRLKFYMNNKSYFTDEQYSQLLEESGLDALEEYDFVNDKIDMLETVYSVLQCLANDIDNFRRIETEFVTTTAAEQYIEKRMLALRKEIERQEDLENSDGHTSSTGYFFINSYQ